MRRPPFREKKPRITHLLHRKTQLATQRFFARDFVERNGDIEEMGPWTGGVTPTEVPDRPEDDE